MPGSQSGSGQGSLNLDDLISLQDAAKLSGLTPGHLRLLIRQGDVWGTKIGRNWVTTEQAVREYQSRARPRGRPTKT